MTVTVKELRAILAVKDDATPVMVGVSDGIKEIKKVASVGVEYNSNTADLTPCKYLLIEV